MVMSDQILVFNAGSSSLKYELFGADGGTALGGEVSGIGGVGWPPLVAPRPGRPCPDPRAAVGRVLEALKAALGDGWWQVDAVGHRIVHGGPSLWRPTKVDDAVVAELVRQTELAPLHNGPSLAALRAARGLLSDVPHVCVVDPGFPHDLPAVPRTYALPRALAGRWELRRYGFHGTSCRYVLARVEALGIAPARRTVVCHLGAGASVTAVLDGRSHDTSMGFTPLEGLVMASRSGDLDPALPLFLER